MFRVRVQLTSESGNPKILVTPCDDLEAAEAISASMKARYPEGVVTIEEF